ncbi:hypothetical protein IKE71_01565 [Candidatus Saccharibacteria bacterium]|nr:hypothetical protein [Candidatus Saccharibacteria bacterium]
MKDYFKDSLIVILVVAVVVLLGISGVIFRNSYEFQVKKAEEISNYETKKIVEDHARSMIAQYTADKLRYETYKESSSAEQQSWAEEARVRANTTAALYNEYMLKNSFVFKDNVPEDIRSELEYIK